MCSENTRPRFSVLSFFRKQGQYQFAHRRHTSELTFTFNIIGFLFPPQNYSMFVFDTVVVFQLQRQSMSARQSRDKLH